TRRLRTATDASNGVEEIAGVGVSDEPRRPPRHEPAPVATLELPAIRADAVDADPGRAADVDARVAGGARAVAVGLDDRRTDLVRAVRQHRAMARAVHHAAHAVAPVHAERTVDVVHGVGREQRCRAVGVAAVDGEAVAHDLAMDRELVLERADAAREIGHLLGEIIHRAPISLDPLPRPFSDAMLNGPRAAGGVASLLDVS